MRNIKLTIEYDGSRYSGWQKLGDTDNTIQSKIEKVLSLMASRSIEIIGSGRTDAGVHACNQVANFKTTSKMSNQEIREYVNHYLPNDIMIKKVEDVQERFHARYNAKSKKYLYRIWNGEVPTVFERKYTYDVPNILDLEAMKKAAKYFVGEHDFKAFSSVKSKKKSTVKEVYDIDIKRVGSEIKILFHGEGFLYNMVRIIVGTLIEVGEGKRLPEDMKKIMEEKIRQNAGATAPAQGLILYEVNY